MWNQCSPVFHFNCLQTTLTALLSWTTTTYRRHHGPTQLLPNFDVLSVQRQTLQIATRGQLCFSRNFYAKHRGTSRCYLYANYTYLVTLRWRHFHRRTHRNKIYEFYEHFNKHHADMQFGTKIQENCKIPLLDCLFTRDNKIIRLGGTTYRKATHTDRFTRSYVIVQPDLSQRLQLYGLWRDARN